MKEPSGSVTLSTCTANTRGGRLTTNALLSCFRAVQIMVRLSHQEWCGWWQSQSPVGYQHAVPSTACCRTCSEMTSSSACALALTTGLCE